MYMHIHTHHGPPVVTKGQVVFGGTLVDETRKLMLARVVVKNRGLPKTVEVSGKRADNWDAAQSTPGGNVVGL